MRGELQADLAYGEHPAQQLDLYRPPGADKAPVFVFVHGGAWSVGDKLQGGAVLAKVEHWVAAGWIVASINYRMLPEAGPQEQAADVARALAWLQSSATRLGADAARCVLAGHSSGAHLVALLSAAPPIAAEQGASRWRASLLLDAAALDVPALMQGEPMPFHERAFGADRDGWERCSPLHRLGDDPVPMLLLCAEGREAMAATAGRFAAAVRARGGVAEVVSLPLSHRALNVGFGSPGPATSAADDFLARHAS